VNSAKGQENMSQTRTESSIAVQERVVRGSVERITGGEEAGVSSSMGNDRTALLLSNWSGFDPGLKSLTEQQWMSALCNHCSRSC
jgi:hypothetical protein